MWHTCACMPYLYLQSLACMPYVSRLRLFGRYEVSLCVSTCLYSCSHGAYVGEHRGMGSMGTNNKVATTTAHTTRSRHRDSTSPPGRLQASGSWVKEPIARSGSASGRACGAWAARPAIVTTDVYTRQPTKPRRFARRARAHRGGRDRGYGGGGDGVGGVRDNYDRRDRY